LQVWEATPGTHIYEDNSQGPPAADEMMGREGYSWRELVHDGK
jgi:glucose-6-phosphate 1-dehydrogenase